VNVEYIVPPRLVDSDGQIMQGDVFHGIPFAHLLPDSDTVPVYAAAILLTPTCDFALKGKHPERQVAPIEAVTADAGVGVPPLPRHLLFLPPLADLLPHGGLLHFRRIVTIHADALTVGNRVATLDASGLRVLLAAQTTYYTRSSIDPAALPLTADDPRLLWEAIDRAQRHSRLAAVRAGLEQATALAIRALLYHHGLRTESAAQSLVLLEQFAQHHAFPKRSIDATDILAQAQTTLRELYAVTPADLPAQHQRLDELATDLDKVGLLLQEAQPLQVTNALLRERGLSNILPR